ncbi:MAG: aldo/keto reductase [Lysobacterales bacterium]
MQNRQLGPLTVSSIGLGCMSMSHAYGAPDQAESERTLLAALDQGYTFFDTAALYGFGANESLVGRVLSTRRKEFVLASKCGMRKGPDGKREINGRPEVIRQTCHESLDRLQTEVIDLYYLHRWDRNVPIEDSVGELSRLLEEGKIRAIGLSEVSADTLRKAHLTHPIAALQSEYSLWSRNPEIAVLKTCRELGVGFVPFSPLGRAFLTGTLRDPEALVEGDLRRSMPRFQGDHFQRNLELLESYESIAKDAGCTMAQLALAWVLAQGDDMVPIPGTWHTAYAAENALAADVTLSEKTLSDLDALINQKTVSGPRYNATTQTEIDTEEFDLVN